jgi:hypothetical protein
MLLILRIRQAETALDDGRLDEAFDLVVPESVRSHRRGQEIVGRLVRKLVERGKGHLLADRVTQAQADCGKAERLGGNLPDTAELRAAINNAIAAQQRNQRKRAMAFAAAREHIDQGRLAAGEKLLAAFASNSSARFMESRAAVLMQDLGAKRAAVESAVRNAAAALDRDDTEAAVREVLHARDADASDPRVGELATKIAADLRERASEAIERGRLDVAEPIVRQLSRIARDSTDAETLARTIQQCRHAWLHLDRGECREASEILRRISAIHPSAKWMTDATKYLKQAEDALHELRTGPLSLLGVSSDSPTEPPPGRSTGVSPVVRKEHGQDARATDCVLPSKFMLRVDGAGSFLVLRQPIVTLGPVSSSRLPDIGLLADPGTAIAMIERADEDYFLRSEFAVAVNDRPVPPRSGKLLGSGDRVALSPRCRFAFATPNVASTTAVIDLTGARYPRSDVRRIILMDGDLIIGPGAATHVRIGDAEGADSNVVLHLRDGRLFCEADQPIEVNGAPLDRTSGIPLGAHVKVGGVSFVVTRD